MRYFYIFCAAISLAAHLTGAEDQNDSETAIVGGFHHYGKETLNSLNVKGAVELVSTTITGLVDVNGSLEARNAKIGQLQVYGAVNIRRSTISGTTSVIGHLFAKDTTFTKEISINSLRTTLEGCTIDSILIHSDKAEDRIQRLSLTNKTVVNGNVVFESGLGEINLSADSKINGTVTGGQVIKQG
jgi:hypothetical protein